MCNIVLASGDVGALVVAARKEEVLGIFDLEAEEQQDGFDGLLSAVDIVAQHEVIRVGRKAALHACRRALIKLLNCHFRAYHFKQP